MKTIRTGNGARNFQCKMVHKKGYKVVVEVSSNPIFDKEENIIGVYTVGKDITELNRIKELDDALNEINMAINSTKEPDSIMRSAICKSSEALYCESGIIALRQHNHWVIKYVYGLLEVPQGSILTDEEIKETFLAAREKKPIVINDTSKDKRINPELVDKFKLCSLLIVPLFVKGEMIGGICFAYHSMPVSFSKAQIDFAEKLAVSVSLSVENSRLFKIQKDISDTLQKSFLTIPDSIDGVEFGQAYHSETETAQVGGDFYDLIELGNNKLGVVVGDVSGKGLQAANLTMTVKNTLKAYAYLEDSPASILSKTNKLVKESTSLDMYATVFFGIIDKVSGEVVYCSAGHPPAMIKRRTSGVELLTGNSPAVGAFDNLIYIDHREKLGKGDILVVYTDGVTEARRMNGEFFREQRLVKFLKKIKKPKAAELPQKLMDKITGFTDGKLTDDIAVIAVSLI